MTTEEFNKTCEDVLARCMTGPDARAYRQCLRRLRVTPREFMWLAIYSGLYGNRAGFGWLRMRRRRVRRWKKQYRGWKRGGRPSLCRAGYQVCRHTPFSRHRVTYAVEYWHVEGGVRFANIDDDPPAMFVCGVGLAGCRRAKRLARSLAADPDRIDRLPADRVDDHDREVVPGRRWWVIVRDLRGRWIDPPADVATPAVA